MNTLESNSDRDILSLPERVGEVAIIVGMLLLFGFFVYHQRSNTGFFTDKFGPLEMFSLYGPLLLSLFAHTVRAWTGHRNLARPFEAASSLFLSLGALWLLIVFPLNAAHLAEPLPTPIHFLITWVTDDIAKVVLLLQIIIGPISVLLTMGKYFSFRRQASDPSFKRRPL